jgi:hypothetical protein
LHLRFDKTFVASQSEDQPEPCVENDKTCHEASCVHAFAKFAIAFEQRNQSLLPDRPCSLWVSYHLRNRKGTFPNVVGTQTPNVHLWVSRKVAAKIRCNILILCKVRLSRPLWSRVYGHPSRETICLPWSIFEISWSASVHVAQPALFRALHERLQKQHNSILEKKCSRQFEMTHKYEARTLCGDVHVFRSRKTLQ